MQVNKFCPHCSVALPPNAARCASCGRFASLNGRVGLAFAVVMSAAAIAWNAYKGISLLWSAVLGVLVLSSLLLLGALLSLPPPQPYSGPFHQTWWKELALGYLLVLPIMAGVAWQAGLEGGEELNGTDVFLAFVAFPAGLAVVSLPMRFLRNHGATAVCEHCGSVMTRGYFCGNCGRGAM